MRLPEVIMVGTIVSSTQVLAAPAPIKQLEEIVQTAQAQQDVHEFARGVPAESRSPEVERVVEIVREETDSALQA